jgi:hypothetical protein
MTNNGNIWSVTVTYPESSVAKTQLYKFVNGNWGNNEGGPGSEIVSSGCGEADGSGNINRTYVIPTANQTLAFCWDQCSSVCNPTGIASSMAIGGNVYPNPFTDFTNIESSEPDYYVIHSLLGKKVAEGLLTKGKNQIETNSLPKGVYILSSQLMAPIRIIKE